MSEGRVVGILTYHTESNGEHNLAGDMKCNLTWTISHANEFLKSNHNFSIQSPFVSDEILGNNLDGTWTLKIQSGPQNSVMGNILYSGSHFAFWKAHCSFKYKSIERFFVFFGNDVCKRQMTFIESRTGPQEDDSSNSNLVLVVSLVFPANISTKFFSTLGWKFREFYESKTLTDFVLRSTDQQEVNVHAVVLASVSQPFKSLILNNKATGSAELTDMDFETLKVLVDAIYGLSVSDRLEDLGEKVYVAAEKYQLEFLKPTISEALEDGLGPDNAVDRYIFAKRHGIVHLAERVIEADTEAFEEYKQSPPMTEIEEKAGDLSKEYRKEFDEKLAGVKRSAATANLDS